MKQWLVSILLPILIVGAGCSGADSGAVFTADEVPSPTVPPTTQLVVPFTTLAPSATETQPQRIVFEQLSILEGGVAEIVGTGATQADIVTVDGAETTFLSFDTGPEGRFVAQVEFLGEGTHTICIGDTCDIVARV